MEEKLDVLIEQYTESKDRALKSMKRLIGKPQQDWHNATFSNLTIFLQDLENLRDTIQSDGE